MQLLLLGKEKKKREDRNLFKEQYCFLNTRASLFWVDQKYVE